MARFLSVVLFLFAVSSVAFELEHLDQTSPFGKRVGKLSFKNADGDQFSCSGTLVSPRIVLTARHCVPLTNTSQLDSSRPLYFDLGYKEGRLPLGVNPIQAKQVWTTKVTTKPGSPNDWAILLLEEAPTPRDFDISKDASILPASNLWKREMFVMGYPGHVRGGEFPVRVKCEYKKKVSGGVFQIDCPLSPGASGSLALGWTTQNGTSIVGIFTSYGYNIIDKIVAEQLAQPIVGSQSYIVKAENFIPTLNQVLAKYSEQPKPQIVQQPQQQQRPQPQRPPQQMVQRPAPQAPAPTYRVVAPTWQNGRWVYPPGTVFLVPVYPGYRR